MRYLLDTNICIYLMQKFPPSVLRKFAALSYGDVVISTITLAELQHGVERSLLLRDRAAASLRHLLDFLPVLPFDQDAAASYGIIAAAICDRRRDALDRLIAAHARSLDLVLVTNNPADFADYPGLKIENWVDDKK